MTDHPIRLVVADDLRRSRLTVFFRLLLAIPHYFWFAIIGSVAGFLVFVNWFVVLFAGRTPQGIHDFLAGWLRYTTHLEAYLFLAANPFPGFFLISSAPYPVDLEIGPPERQSRWKTFFRLLLAFPALIIWSTYVGLGGGPRSGSFSVGGITPTTSFLIWFAALVRGRAPRGLRDLTAYTIGYGAQTWAYLFLLTDRYPHSGPSAFVPAEPVPEPHPVRMTVADDLRRSRLLVLFRLPIATPHVFWLLLWSVPALVAVPLNWLCALVIGRAPRPFHRFLGAYVRYVTHFYAFLFLVGNPFPGFTGKPGSYPVDLEIEGPERQSRAVTLFRLVLAVPAGIVAGTLGSTLFAVAFLAWFAALARGRMPAGLQNLGAYVLRYAAQVSAYLYVLTARYPDSGPRPDPASP